MTDITLTGSIISIYPGSNAANIFVIDRDNPKNTVFKIAFWDAEARAVLAALSKGDEISVSGKVYCVGSNKYGSYIELRMCQLVNMMKIQRRIIDYSDVEADEEESQPQEGE